MMVAMTVPGAMVMAAMVMAVAPVAMVVALIDPKIIQKCGFLATFFWLTNKSQFAIILVL
jgi:hypothetical protein